MTNKNMTIPAATVSTPCYVRKLRLIVLAVVVGSVLMLVFKEPPYTNLDNEQLQIMLDNNAPLYDVRRPEEWKQTGVIEGSRLLTYIDMKGQVKPDFLIRLTAEVAKDDPIILICRTGSRTSRLAHYLMAELGYTNVFNVDDGINKWLRENKPVKQIMQPAIDRYGGRGVL